MMDIFASVQSYGDIGLLVLRLFIGVIFIYHAIPKLNGSMGGFMMFIGCCELPGGIAVALGFLTQLAALGLSIIMLGAIYKKTQEWHIPFFAMDKTGWEYDFMILGSGIALFLLGPGSLSLDRILFTL